MNISEVFIRRPIGTTLLAIGLGILVLADLALAFLPSVGGVLFGVALWGVHMGVSQGLLSALVADAAPDRLRGTAFGVFNLAIGLTLLVASALAGVLWSRFGAPATFVAGGAFCAVAGTSAGVAAASAAFSSSSDLRADGAAIVATVKSRSLMTGVTPSGSLIAEILIASPISRPSTSASRYSGMAVAGA